MSPDRRPQAPGRRKAVSRKWARTLWRSVLCGLLVMVPGTLGYLTGNLWLFPSLGPSVVLAVVLPHQETSRTYNIFVGHLTGIACGFAAVLAIGAAGTPSAFSSGQLLAPHIAAAGLAVTAMVLLQLSARAIHPPGSSTAIMIAPGVFRPTWHDFLVILIGVAITTIACEAVKRLLIPEPGEVAGP